MIMNRKPVDRTEMEVKMGKKWLCILVSLFFVIGLSSSALACGGGGGGDPLGSSPSEADTPPSNFEPIVLDDTYVMDPPETTSVDPTPETVLDEDDLGLTSEAMANLLAEIADDPNVKFVAVVTGGIIVGYATAGLGLPTYAQGLASGTFTVWAGGSATSGVKDFFISYIRVPPPVQSGISIAVDQTAEAASAAIGPRVPYYPAYNIQSPPNTLNAN